MAKFTLTVEDGTNDDGQPDVKVRFESDPAWPGPAAEDQTLTTAQRIGLELIEPVTEFIGNNFGPKKKKKGE